MLSPLHIQFTSYSRPMKYISVLPLSQLRSIEAQSHFVTFKQPQPTHCGVGYKPPVSDAMLAIKESDIGLQLSILRIPESYCFTDGPV